MLGYQFKFLLGLVGLSTTTKLNVTAQTPPPATDPLTNAEKFIKTCGIIHGYFCSGNCAPNMNGNTGCTDGKQAGGWVSCCRQNPMMTPAKYQCYQLWDWVCTTRGANYGKDCIGTTPGGTVWPLGIGKGDYVCTSFKAVGNVVGTSTDFADECKKAKPPNQTC